MTKQKDDAPAGEIEWIEPPDWVPESVAARVCSTEAMSCATPEERAILRRLATEPRMKGVWSTLKRRKRSTGEYYHPAQPGAFPDATTKDEAQAEGLALTLFVAFSAARDQISVSKADEVAPVREKLLEEAKNLRQIASDLEATNPYDAAAFGRVAEYAEAGAGAIRGPDDPLTIAKDRGDRIARGVAIVIAAHLKETFGTPLYGTAATLAAVALGRKTDARAVRSAVSRPNRG